METFIIVTYCASDDARKNLGILDDVQTKVGIAQIMTTIIVAAEYFGGNHKLAQEFLHEHRYFHYKLSPSQFNRRFHNIPASYFNELVEQFSKYAKMMNESFEFAIDSFPVPVCDNIRITRNKLFDPKRFRGLIASKRRYFLGFRVHMIATANRLPVEFKILPGAENDAKGAQKLAFNLPHGSVVFGDKAYSNYTHEDNLKKTKNIDLEPLRKSNSRRMRDTGDEMIIKRKRKPIETLFSSITRLLPKHIHAVTAKGFFKKIFCFVLAHCMSCYRVTT
jgi:hypothetical protein